MYAHQGTNRRKKLNKNQFKTQNIDKVKEIKHEKMKADHLTQ